MQFTKKMRNVLSLRHSAFLIEDKLRMLITTAKNEKKIFISEDQPPTVGGQAVIEGVMMRSPFAVATAVRQADGAIRVNAFHFISLSKRSKFWGLPIIRGAVNLVEALYLGIKTLNWSAAIASNEDGKDAKQPSGLFTKLWSALSIFTATLLALGIFMYLPYLISGLAGGTSANQILFHLIAGSIRIILFLGYIYAISFWKEIRRVFEYHGAEHKSIFAFEKTGGTQVSAARDYSRFHPRCGTSFLLITAVIIIFIFAVLDSILVSLFGAYQGPLHRLIVHLPFIPLVAGISYETLKFSGEKRDHPLWRHLIKPGLWLQRITTREPDASQIEVAVAALESCLDQQYDQSVCA